jgi:hypothetical protein
MRKNKSRPKRGRGGTALLLNVFFWQPRAEWAATRPIPEPPMRQRGRKSAASLGVVPIGQPQRPEPPERLPEAEKQVWRDIVDRLRPDWFGGAEHLLEIYVTSIVLERFLAEQIRKTRVDDQRFAELVKLQRAEAALVANLATKLRLSPRSTWDRHTPKLVSTQPKPWELGSGSRRGFEDEMRKLEQSCKKSEDSEEPPPAA